MHKFKADKTPPFLQASADKDEGMVGMEEEESSEETSEAARGISAHRAAEAGGG
jgi:hypothetical protein